MRKPKTEPHKILIYPPNPLGDLVMSIPAMVALRETFPSSGIFLFARPTAQQVVGGCGWFDELVTNPMGKWAGSVRGFALAVIALRRIAPDLAVIFPNSLASALMCALSGVPRRIGYDRDARGFLLTDRVHPPEGRGIFVPRPMIEYYGHLVRGLGCEPKDGGMRIKVQPDVAEKAEAFLRRRGVRLDRPIVGIAPGAGYGPSKHWVDSYYAVVSDHLVRRYGCETVILTGPGEGLLGERIASSAAKRIIHLGDEEISVELLIGLIQRCRLLIATDSGPRHLAMALGLPVVAILGPTDPIYSDMGYKDTIILYDEDAECRPCMLPRCPTDHRCMTELKPERVISAAECLLERKGGGNFASVRAFR